jgi:TRAP-type C4-dicarboxylate transport system substrate-binding protein
MKLRLVSAAALSVAIATPVAAQNVELVVNCFTPPQHFLCSQLLPGWLEQVRIATEGRVTGTILPTSAAPPPDQLAAVRAGQVDVAVQFNGLIPGETVGSRVAMIPFSGGDSAEQNSAALWATTRTFFPDEFPDVQLLSQFVISAVQVYSLTDRPVTSMADLSGRRIWALPGPLAQIGNTIGAGVVATPAVESRDILSRGVVDASIGPEPHTVESLQLTRYMRSMTTFEQPVYTSSFSMVMNAGTWSRISEQDRAAIEGVSGEAFARAAGSAWDASNASVLANFAQAGMTTIEADSAFNAEMRAAARFLTDAWLANAAAAGIDGAAALDFYSSAARD